MLNIVQCFHSSNIVRHIQTKRQKKHGETIKETSRSLIKEWVNKWPSSILLDSDDEEAVSHGSLFLIVRILHFGLKALNIHCLFPYH
jgi:hypothetical protein